MHTGIHTYHVYTLALTYTRTRARIYAHAHVHVYARAICKGFSDVHWTLWSFCVTPTCVPVPTVVTHVRCALPGPGGCFHGGAVQKVKDHFDVCLRQTYV